MDMQYCETCDLSYRFNSAPGLVGCPRCELMQAVAALRLVPQTSVCLFCNSMKCRAPCPRVTMPQVWATLQVRA